MKPSGGSTLRRVAANLWRRVDVGLLATAAVIAWYIVTQHVSKGALLQSDGVPTYMWARSIAFDFDLDLTNDNTICGVPTVRVSPDLRPSNYHGIGSGLLLAPFLLVARLLVTVKGNAAFAAGCAGPIAHYGLMGAAVLAGFALWFGYRIARTYVGRQPAALALLLIGVGSPLFHYAAVVPSYTHAPSAFAVGLFLERWHATRGSVSVRRWAMLGALISLVALVRADCGLVIVPAAVEWIVHAYREVRRRGVSALGRPLGILVAAALAASVVFAPQIWVWHMTWGGWLREGHVHIKYMRWDEPDFMGPLFFCFSGLLANSPVLYASIVGWTLVPARGARWVGLACLWVFLATLIVTASAWDWWGAAGYPGRRFSAVSTAFVVGAAFFIGWLTEKARRSSQAVVAIATGLVILAAGTWTRAWPVGTDRVAPPAQRYGEWAAAAVSTFVQAFGYPPSWPAELMFRARYGTDGARYHDMAPFSVTYRSPEGNVQVNGLSARQTAFFSRGFAIDLAPNGSRQGCAPGAQLLIPLQTGHIKAARLRWRREDGFVGPLTVTWNGHPAHTLADNGGGTSTSEIPLSRSEASSGTNEVLFRNAKGCWGFEEITFVE